MNSLLHCQSIFSPHDHQCNHQDLCIAPLSATTDPSQGSYGIHAVSDLHVWQRSVSINEMYVPCTCTRGSHIHKAWLIYVIDIDFPNIP